MTTCATGKQPSLPLILFQFILAATIQPNGFAQALKADHIQVIAKIVVPAELVLQSQDLAQNGISLAISSPGLCRCARPASVI